MNPTSKTDSHRNFSEEMTCKMSLWPDSANIIKTKAVYYGKLIGKLINNVFPGPNCGLAPLPMKGGVTCSIGVEGRAPMFLI